MNKDRLLQKFSKEQLADIILRKDEELEHLKSIREGIKYIGRLDIDGIYFNFYIRKKND